MMTPWVKRLILASVAMFIVMMAYPPVTRSLILVPALVVVRPWTVVTYMFLHAGLLHLLFNMIGLLFFGPRLEARLGGRHFLGLYLVSGLTGALLSVFAPHARIVGASGAVFGVLLGFARYWPHERIHIWGVLPIEARWLVVILTVLALWGGITGSQGGVAHFAHLGGFAGGYLYLQWRERTSPAVRFRAQVAPAPKKMSSGDVERWRKVDLEALHPVNREEYERLLRKVESHGAGLLTPSERAFLDRFAPG
ncbi:MAG: rhomboid family intramembrane serine protease [Gemmatimonadetes bacterium]|nr:rhomboid family intramembrane serine protease [Gemmatimonadota bacterium]